MHMHCHHAHILSRSKRLRGENAEYVTAAAGEDGVADAGNGKSAKRSFDDGMGLIPRQVCKRAYLRSQA